MKKIGMLLATVITVLLFATPAIAASLTISPPSVEFSVPANGSAQVEFLVSDFQGNLNISLENIPLKVEPTTVPVTAKEGGTKVVLTFYGDESFGSQVFNGKIRFLAMTGGTVAMGIKVKAKVTVEGQPVSEKPVTTKNLPPEKPVLPALTTPSEQPITPSEPPTPQYPQKTEFPIIPVVAIAAGVIVAVTLIVTLIRRRRD